MERTQRKRMSETRATNHKEHKEGAATKNSMAPKEARQARECALRALFQMDMAGGDKEKALEFAASPEVAGEVSVKASDYARTLLEGVLASREDIDAILTRLSKDWSIDRMAYTDRNIMRMAIYEMMQVEGMSHAVAINEAVELGKAFGTEESPRFINGIVGKLAEELKAS